MLIDHDSAAAAAASAAKKPTATTESCHAVVVFNYACVWPSAFSGTYCSFSIGLLVAQKFGPLIICGQRSAFPLLYDEPRWVIEPFR